MKTVKSKIDITDEVMSRVVRFEKRRISGWFIRFCLILIASAAVLLSSLILLIGHLSSQQSWDLLNLFEEDIEIIGQYWQDTVITFWEEMPQAFLGIIIVVTAVLISFLYYSGKKYKIIKTKIHNLDKYK